MEIDFPHTHNPNLFGSLSVSPPASMLDSLSPLLHFHDDFSDVLNPTATTAMSATSIPDDDIDDWMKPLLFDQLFEHDFLSPEFSSDDMEIKNENLENRKSFSMNNNNYSLIIDDKYLPQRSQITRENELIDFFHHHSTEQQLPSTTTTTTTTVRLIHQPKIEPAELPTTLYVSGNELQFHPIVTTNNTIGHTYTSRNFRLFLDLNRIGFVP